MFEEVVVLRKALEICTKEFQEFAQKCGMILQNDTRHYMELAHKQLTEENDSDT